MKKSVSDAFKIQKDMMSIMGYWHRKKSTIFYTFRKVLTMAVFITAYIGMVMQFIHDITDFQKLSEILYMMISYTSYFCKLLGYFYARHTFLGTLHHLKNPIFTDYSPDLNYHLSNILNLSISITKLYRISCAMVVILFTIYPIFDNKPLPTPIPFDMGRYNFLMYIIQSFALLIAAWNNFCLDTLCTCFMGIAIGQFDILREKILKFRETAIIEVRSKRNELNLTFNSIELQLEIDKVAEKVLRNCIAHHNSLIKYIEQIENIFSFGLLAQLLGSIIVICNTGFFLLLVPPASFQFGMLFSYFITMMAQLSLYCWYGNEIMLKSVEIGEACYLSQWYNCNTSVKNSLFIVMERSKRPLVITALKFSNLSLTSFSSIMQWSYSYFALLRRLENKMVNDLY